MTSYPHLSSLIAHASPKIPAKASSYDIDFKGNTYTLAQQIAIVTHYLNLWGKKEDLCFGEAADYFIKSWEKYSQEEDTQISGEPSFLQLSLFNEIRKVPFPGPENPNFTFIDLFAGIGGFRLAMQNVGGECVFSSEWDVHAQKTYFANYGEFPFGDITSELTKSYVPDNFDVLCAGFPCQAFSVAGYRRGFEDTRGTLFFDVAEIVRRKRPRVVFLENVKNLYSHDDGKTFAVIKGTLEELGYKVFFRVLNAKDFANVPQNRERIFIVCFDPDRVERWKDFHFPNPEELTRTIHDCIDYSVENPEYFYTERMNHYDEMKKHIVSPDTVYQWRRQYVRENKSNVCPTLTANMGGGGHNVPLILTPKGIRKLTPKECLNFQGYPEPFVFPNSIPNSAKYKQAGNSVVVPLIQRICQQITSIL